MSNEGYKDVFRDDNGSLGDFLKTLKDFNEQFCSAMMSDVDFTLKLEIRGDKGRMLHCRVQGDRWRRPKGVGKNTKNPEIPLGESR